MMTYDAVHRSIRQGLAATRVPELCRAELAGIAAGDRELRAVRHPLGFTCLPVRRGGEYGVCVHVWPAVAAPPIATSRVHSHSWDLTSVVLYGAIENVLLDVVADERGGHRIFEVHSRDGRDEVRATGRRVQLVGQRRQPVPAGQVYLMRAGQFHRTELRPGTGAATVVLARMRAGIDLSVGPLDTPSHRVDRELCDARSTAGVAGAVLRRLAAGTDPTGSSGG